jgi:glycosyltransferase involved in cell wall biosynthesis
MKVLLANKYFFRKGGSEAVMFAERDFLLGANVEIVDFSMHGDANLASDYADYFVRELSYEDGALGAADRLRAALKLVHSAEAVRRMGELIELTRPDLVHCHNVYHQLTPSIIGAAKRRGVPVVLTLHDYKAVCPVHTRLRRGRPCSDCLGGKVSNVLKHRCAGGSLGRSALLYAEAVIQRLLRSYEKVDAVIAPSEFMRASVTQARFPGDRVHVLHNGVDTEKLRPGGEDDGYVLYLGRLSAEKGAESLLAAHESLSSLSDPMPLRLAGTGPLESTLRSRYPKAEFLGHLSGPALADVLRRAAAVVLPSECYENCPVAVLEAMSYGKPVIASDIGGIPELVIHGETGLLFPAGDRRALADCLATLASSPDLRRRYGAAGRNRAVSRFSLERHNDGLMRVYQNVLRQKAKALAGSTSLRAVSPQQ